MIKINKISIATLAAAGLVFCSTSAFADGAPFVDQNPIVVANNEVGIAATGTLMNYQEHITPGPSDTESGWMPGFRVSASGMNSDSGLLPLVYLAVAYQYNNHSVTYHGALLNPGHTPLTDPSASVTQSASVKLGKGFNITNDLMITPYVTYNWYHWSRSSGINHEIYSQNSVGVGFMTQYSPMQDLVLGVDAAWLYGIGSGMHKPEASVASLGGPYVEYAPPGQNYHIKNRATVKVSLDADYTIAHSWHIIGGVQYMHTNFGQSPGVSSYLVDTNTGAATPLPDRYAFYEPDSSTNLFTLSLGIAYAF
ncbi:autotransporter outer membrane beta-barrel domain-containing protein [Acidithiobacillus ferriphilus]|jgi:hypothetical protein|uniref:autotransporter outer membrane beta-barrel domain-containing protein n=1 Tax=Acidithiobacillus ferriphilus TaxID=1689834 RepID=UPI001C06E926|nr:autotransporter outer membrane beta-barrel domain-containing protein [Acidithiobacillus ferriphilus]MBU2831571.1 autotransporter outer membrane beta-barrel domain-containing protein [Acidithiobacillus ferriphilus]MBU2852550.1 autotransporter outer membrane beta-barrel domain-containing protein [Acidithiobacillus ferriphilus]